MKLVDVEYTFDNSKLLFYFTAEGRVDFRELVKDLASVFRTRIELRQIGIRDEAKLMGGLGVCGRPFCCASFLPDFVQVSIKMAKEQNLSLNSAKISGACGRLMCCLRYEYDTYSEEIPSSIPRTARVLSSKRRLLRDCARFRLQRIRQASSSTIATTLRSREAQRAERILRPRPLSPKTGIQNPELSAEPDNSRKQKDKSSVNFQKPLIYRQNCAIMHL